jgi:hypothetical protein
MGSIEKIRRVPLREVWKHEARNFSTWLQDNLDVINDTIDIELVGAEREQSAGAFSVDLVAEDDGGNTVIIENQLERSNHDHLGKVITYLVAMDARTAIWIVSDPRPEHVAAISWLNESSSTDFYLLKIEAIKIGDSLPAALVTKIVGPSEEGKNVGRTKQELSERFSLRQQYWAALLEQAKTISKLHSSVTASKYNWIGTGAGITGITYNYVVRQNDSHIELYIDKGKEGEVWNKNTFKALFAKKNEIEAAFGEELEWQQLEGKRACRIKKLVSAGGYRDDESKWPIIHQEMIETMARFEKTLKSHIKTLK